MYWKLQFNSNYAIGFPDFSQPVLTFLRGRVGTVRKSGCLEILASTAMVKSPNTNEGTDFDFMSPFQGLKFRLSTHRRTGRSTCAKVYRPFRALELCFTLRKSIAYFGFKPLMKRSLYSWSPYGYCYRPLSRPSLQSPVAKHAPHQIHRQWR